MRLTSVAVGLTAMMLLLQCASGRNVAIFPVGNGFIELDTATHEFRVRYMDVFRNSNLDYSDSTWLSTESFSLTSSSTYSEAYSIFKDLEYIPELGEIAFLGTDWHSGLYFVNPVTGEWRNWNGYRQEDQTSGTYNGPLTNAQFYDPMALDYDTEIKTLYVADTANSVVRAVDYSDVENPFVSTFAGLMANGNGGTIHDGMASQTELDEPFALAVDQTNGDVWVGEATYAQLYRITRDGVLKNMSIADPGASGLEMGQFDSEYAMIDGTVVHSQYCSIRALSFNEDYSKLYILDGGDRCNMPVVLRELDMATMMVQTRYGRIDMTSGSDDSTFWQAHFNGAGREGVLSEYAGGIAVDVDGMIYINEACLTGGVIRRINPYAGWSSEIIFGDGTMSECGGDANGQDFYIRDSFDDENPETYTDADAKVAKRTWSGAAGNGRATSVRQSIGMLLMTIACGKYYKAGAAVSSDCADGLTSDATVAALDVPAGSSATVAANIVSLAPVAVSGSTLYMAGGSLTTPELMMSNGAVLKVLVASATPAMIMVSGDAMVDGANVVLVVAHEFNFAAGKSYPIIGYGGRVRGGFDSTAVVQETPGAVRRLLAGSSFASTSCSGGRCVATARATPKDDDLRWIAAVIVLSVALVAALLYIGASKLRTGAAAGSSSAAAPKAGADATTTEDDETETELSGESA